MQPSLNDLREPFHDNFSCANAIIIKRKLYTRWFSKVEWDIKLLEETPDNFIIFDTPKGLKTHFYKENLKSFKINASWNFSNNDIIIVEQVCGLVYSLAFTIIHENMPG